MDNLLSDKREVGGEEGGGRTREEERGGEEREGRVSKLDFTSPRRNHFSYSSPRTTSTPEAGLPEESIHRSRREGRRERPVNSRTRGGRTTLDRTGFFL